ncbi:MAG TPA: sigma-70 family RNA polymerase sigma factor, partial [Bacteroidales bacterium]|nr:sigma-70 family RNA polymerase sigma factor [Bacteroidales bacterium]
MFQSLLIHSIETFKPWLYTVTKHYCFQILRSHAYTKEISIEHEYFSEIRMENDDGNHLQEKIALEEKMLLFEQQLEGLSKEQRLCIELFYVKKKCYKEISNETGFNLNQVKSYIQNGKRNLQIRVIQT